MGERTSRRMRNRQSLWRRAIAWVKTKTARHRWWLGLGTAIAVLATAASTVGLTIVLGAGTSFPAPLYDRYFDAFSQETGAIVKYNVTGTGIGIQKFLQGEVDFAGTDVPLSAEQQTQLGDRGSLLIPTAGGGVAIVYNLRGDATDVRLSRENIASIFTGEITNWQQINPRLPNQEVRVVVRSDASGTTYVFSRFLNAITEGEFPKSLLPDWGFDYFAARELDAGVASAVSATNGTIGYVQVAYGREANLPAARIENRSGEYILPRFEEVYRGLETAEYDDDFVPRGFVDPPEGYPIVGPTWLLLYQRYPNPELGQAVKEMALWILNQGQDINETLKYTRLSEDLRGRAIDAVGDQIQ